MIFMKEKNCNKWRASQYAGYSLTEGSKEYCLMFCEELEVREDMSTKPCKKCNGDFFKEDN